MGYTPTIITDAEGLESKRKDIEEQFYEQVDDSMEETDVAYKELYSWLDHKPVEFKGIKFHLITEELTGRNAEIRRVLDELKIEYAVYY